MITLYLLIYLILTTFSTSNCLLYGSPVIVDCDHGALQLLVLVDHFSIVDSHFLMIVLQY